MDRGPTQIPHFTDADATYRMVTDRKLHTITRQLREITDYYEQAHAELTIGTGTGRRSTEVSIGCNVAALDFLAGNTILPDLEQVEKEVRKLHNLPPYGVASLLRYNPDDPTGSLLRGVCDFLLVWLPKTTIDDATLLKIKTVHAEARNAARVQTPNQWSIRCCTDDCDTLIRITDPDVDQLVTCPKCHHTLTLMRLLLITSSTHNELWLDPEAAAQLLGVTQGCLRKWARSGKIARRNNQYNVSDLRNLTDDPGTVSVRYSSARRTPN